MSMSTEGQKTFTHGTSIQNQTQKSNIAVQLTEETSSYSARCNIQNSADRNVKYREDGQISPMRWCMPSVSHSAFLPTVLLMFQPLHKHVNRYSEGDLLSLTAMKTRNWAPRPHLLLFPEASPKRVDVRMYLMTARQTPTRKGAGRSTRSASLPWRNAASKTPAM